MAHIHRKAPVNDFEHPRVKVLRRWIICFALGMLSLSACTSQESNRLDAKARQAAMHASYLKQRVEQHWSSYQEAVQIEAEIEAGTMQGKRASWSFFTPRENFMDSFPFGLSRAGRDSGEALDVERYTLLRAKAKAKFDAALVELDKELQIYFGEYYDEYVLHCLPSDILGDDIARGRETFPRADEAFEQGKARGQAYFDSLVELRDAGVKATTSDDIQVRIVDAGIERADWGMVVLELRSLDPTSILYLNLQDYGTYQDDSGVKRSYRYYTGVNVTDEFGNKYQIRSIEVGSFYPGLGWSYRRNVNEDDSLKSGQPLRLKFAFSPLPPVAATSAEFVFKKGSLSKEEEVRFVVSAKHFQVRGVSLKENPMTETKGD